MKGVGKMTSGERGDERSTEVGLVNVDVDAVKG